MPAALASGQTFPTPSGILVGCGEGTALLVTELQLEGKKRLPAAEFLKGVPLPSGTVLGAAAPIATPPASTTPGT